MDTKPQFVITQLSHYTQRVVRGKISSSQEAEREQTLEG